MPLPQLIDLIVNAGIAVVVCSVFLLFMMKQFNNVQKQNNAMFDKLLNSPEVNPEKAEIAASIFDDNVNDILESLLFTTNSARCFYISFHNGDKDLNGIHFRKMSMRHEKVRNNIAHTMSDFQVQNRNLFKHFISAMETDGEYFYEKGVTNIPEENIQDFLDDRGIDVSYLVPIKNRYGGMGGVLGMEYLNKEHLISIDKLKIYTDASKKAIESIIKFEDQ